MHKLHTSAWPGNQ